MIFLGYKPSGISCIMRFLLYGLNLTGIVIRGSVCIMHVYSLVSYRDILQDRNGDSCANDNRQDGVDNDVVFQLLETLQPMELSICMDDS